MGAVKTVVSCKNGGRTRTEHSSGDQPRREGIFAELESQAQMDYIPVRGRVGNQIWLLSGILAHNLSREMQMIADEPARSTTEKRSPLWIFRRIETLRRNLLQRAATITSRSPSLNNGIMIPHRPEGD